MKNVQARLMSPPKINIDLVITTTISTSRLWTVRSSHAKLTQDGLKQESGRPVTRRIQNDAGFGTGVR